MVFSYMRGRESESKRERESEGEKEGERGLGIFCSTVSKGKVV